MAFKKIGLNKIIRFIWLLPVFITGCKKVQYPDMPFLPGPKYKIIADYGHYGLNKVTEWNPFPDNITSSVETEIVNGALKVSYDVYSEDYVQNGVNIVMEKGNLSPYSRLHIVIRGDSIAGYPDNLEITLLSAGAQLSSVMLTGITGKWENFSVPLKRFGTIADLKRVTGIRFVFCSQKTEPPTGIIYVGSIFLERKEMEL